MAWPLHVHSAGTWSTLLMSEWKQGPVADNCHAFQQVLHLASQGATVWTPRREWLSVTWLGWDMLERLQIGWYWTWVSRSWLGEDFRVCVGESDKSCLQWQQLVWRHSGKDDVKKGELWFSFPWGLSLGQYLLYFLFYSLGHRYSVVTYVTEPLLRRGQDHFSNIYRINFG